MHPPELEPLQKHFKSLSHVGSRVICIDVPPDTDDDWLALVEGLNAFEEEAFSFGWTVGGSLPSGQQPDYGFCSFTKAGSKVNLIATQNVLFRDRFVEATEIAKHLQLFSKPERIKLFRKVLYNEA